MAAKIIAIANQKGGVGKTTTCAALGDVFSSAGKRILWIDWDAQGNLTSAVGGDRDRRFYDALAGYIYRDELPVTASLARHMSSSEHLLASHIAMAALDVDLLQMPSGADHVLADVLEPEAGHYDYILIDCPPSLSRITTNALMAAGEVLIPVTPEPLAVEGLGLMLDTIGKIRRHGNRSLKIAGILPTMVDARTNAHKIMLQGIHMICLRYSVPELPAIPNSTRAVEASGAGVPVTRYPGANGLGDAYRAVGALLMEEA